MRYLKDFKKLCSPASVYLFINVIIFISIAIQNFGNTTQYCVGQYKCNVSNTFSLFLFKAIYILFWTFILNAVCKAGYKEVSWFMVLMPIILLFIILGMIILNSGSARFYEGFYEGMEETDESATIKDDNVSDTNNVEFTCSSQTTEASCNLFYDSKGCKWTPGTPGSCINTQQNDTGSVVQK